MLRAEAARLACESGTSFGRAVVPEVCSSSAVSPLDAGPGRPAESALDAASRNPPAALVRSSWITPDPQFGRGLGGHATGRAFHDERTGFEAMQGVPELALAQWRDSGARPQRPMTPPPRRRLPCEARCRGPSATASPRPAPLRLSVSAVPAARSRSCPVAQARSALLDQRGRSGRMPVQQSGDRRGFVRILGVHQGGVGTAALKPSKYSRPGPATRSRGPRALPLPRSSRPTCVPPGAFRRHR